MKQEIAKKYLKEIEYFANGGELLCKNDKDCEWYIAKEPSFNNPHAIYIIADEYRKYRKALTKGEPIQYLSDGTWVDLYEEEFYPNMKYRIKPKFKVNDFVVSPDGDIEQIYSLREINGKLSAQFSEVQEDGTDDISEWKLWQPEIGKYNLFKNKDTNYVLAKLIDTKDGLYKIQYKPFNKSIRHEYYEQWITKRIKPRLS